MANNVEVKLKVGNLIPIVYVGFFQKDFAKI